MKLITNKTIRDLYPCANRHNNYLKYYRDKSHTYAQFLGLKHISHSDKVWVAVRLIHPKLLRFCAAEIARLVLPIFEARYPNDNRPRLAIEAAEAKVLDVDKAIARANAAHAANAAAKDAYAAAYYANAYAAYAACDAASAAAYAAYAAANVAYTANDVGAVSCAAHNSIDAVRSNNKPGMERKIRTILLKYLNKSEE